MKKAAIVTGGTRGLGRAIVEKLQSVGYSVFFTYKNSEQRAMEIESLYSDGSVQGLKINISERQEVDHFIKLVQSKNLYIDLLVLNSGITRDVLFATMNEADWINVNKVNHLDNFFLLQAVGKIMIYQKSGQIIFISSIAALSGGVGQSNYSSSKGAINSFAKSLSKEMGRHNVRINVISPGFVETDMLKKLDPAQIREVLKKIPIGRIGKPQDIASVVSFLASDEARYIHGANVVVDGGLT